MSQKRFQYFMLSGKDTPGELSGILNTLHENRIELEGMWGYGKGTASEIYLVPKDAAKFRSAAQKMNMNYREGTCFKVDTDDRPGAYTETFNRIAQTGVNLLAANAITSGTQSSCFIWTAEKDTAAVARALGL